MHPSQINPGSCYFHNNHWGIVYRGVIRNGEKRLVIEAVEHDKDKDKVGNIVVQASKASPAGEILALEAFWAGFNKYPISWLPDDISEEYIFPLFS